MYVIEIVYGQLQDFFPQKREGGVGFKNNNYGYHVVWKQISGRGAYLAGRGGSNGNETNKLSFNSRDLQGITFNSNKGILLKELFEAS